MIRAADLLPLVPVLVLVGAALVLLVLARRIRAGGVAPLVTVLAALGAGAASLWNHGESPVGFGGLVALDDYGAFSRSPPPRPSR